MANITLYKHGDLKIYLELFAEDSVIGFKEVGGIHISETYRDFSDDEFNQMAKELEELIIKLNNPDTSERDKVELYIDYISYWDGHQDTHIIDDEDELAEHLDENGNIDEDDPYVFKLNGFYIYDEL
jgi:hypothetical protein